MKILFEINYIRSEKKFIAIWIWFLCMCTAATAAAAAVCLPSISHSLSPLSLFVSFFLIHD